MTEIIWIILGILLIIWGIIWCFLPILPGPLLVYASLFLLQITTDHPFSLNYLLIRFAITVFVTILDYFIPILWTKKMWWSKWGSRGATIGLILWIILLPLLWVTIWPFGIIWIIWGPFIGAYIGEKIYGKSHALKSALWSFLWFITGTIIKLVIAIIMSIAFFKESRHIIQSFF